MIQTQPLTVNITIREYMMMLLKRFVVPHFRFGVGEIHVIFDNPGAMKESPKEIEQRRRGSKNVKQSHDCVRLCGETAVPEAWRSFINCRVCKKSLTHVIASASLEIIVPFLSSHQTFITTIAESAFEVSSDDNKLPVPYLWSNADEADLRVWLHCVHSHGHQILIFSPDTDVYHIGLPITQQMPHLHVVVQLSMQTTGANTKLLDLKALSNALSSDPDLISIPLYQCAQAIQSLYACTGCDYISFFVGCGKTTLLFIIP